MNLLEVDKDKKYFVCFIDLLGFSKLTEDPDNNDEIICGNLKKLHSFVKNEEKSIASYVLSDSVFLISENLEDILYSISNIFRNCILNGILLRAGLAYGKCCVLDTELGQNIFGDAVSKAVKLEGSGKGCKVFIDKNVLLQLVRENCSYGSIFSFHKSQIDYKIIDVFEWVMINVDYFYRKKSVEDQTKTDKNNLKKIILANLDLINNLRFSPNYSWNASSTEGRVHLYATIDYISDITERIRNESTKIKDDFAFDYETLSDGTEINRSKDIIKNMNERYKKLLDKYFN